MLRLAAGVAWAGDEIRPVSNPVLVDSPGVGTSIHPNFIYQAPPGVMETMAGDIPAGGDFQVYAVQFEYAFNAARVFYDCPRRVCLTGRACWMNLAV